MFGRLKNFCYLCIEPKEIHIMETKQMKSDVILNQAKRELEKFIAYEILLISKSENGNIPLDCKINRVVDGENEPMLATERVMSVSRDADGNVFFDTFCKRPLAKLGIEAIKTISDAIEREYNLLLG